MAFRILHHASRADVNLQVADYCAWALYRKWERDDLRSVRIVTAAGLEWIETRLSAAE